MAMVNVGVELARAGKRVLLVDFDLEAPSLTTFNLGAAQTSSRGIVEYVCDYLKDDRAPNVSDFISEPESFPSGGKLWVMPAGANTDDYRERLSTINWFELYEQRSGYLLMEELKAQWRTVLNPDYVLIDSRTGHSDVSGICTRQLPNAVCFVFVPNRQNLEGLAKTVAQVRVPFADTAGRKIQLFFVESNVPYYDDERRTLAKNRQLFCERLKINAFDATLHQYPHLSVLNQSVFVQEFPETNLAEEYRKLTETVRRENLADRDVVLPLLKRMAEGQWFSRAIGVTNGVDKLSEISRLHDSDPEIVFWLGRISRSMEEVDIALVQINQAIEGGFRRPEAYLERASLCLLGKREGRIEEAKADLHTALGLLAEKPKLSDVLYALRTLTSIAPQSAVEYADARAVEVLSQSDKIYLAAELMTSDAGNALAYSILSRLGNEKMDGEIRSRWRINFSLSCIQQKKFSEAVSVLQVEETQAIQEQARLFNLGVALWAFEHSAPRAQFERVLGLHERLTDRHVDANYLQCIAIALYVCGRTEEALVSLERAKRLANQIPFQHFSAWRYSKISPSEFVADCAELGRQIAENSPLAFPAIQQTPGTETRH